MASRPKGWGHRPSYWSTMDCIAEGRRNFVSGRGRSLVAVLFCSLILGLTGLVEAALVGELVQDADEFDEAGGYVLVVSGSVDGAACQQVRSLVGIRGSAAANRSSERINLGVPGSNAVLGTWSSGVEALSTVEVGSWPTGHELLSTPVMVQEADLAVGRHVEAALDQEGDVWTAYVSGEASLDRLGQEFAGGVHMSGLLEGSVGFCVIEAEPRWFAEYRDVAAALVVECCGNEAKVVPRITRSDFDRDFVADYKTRPTRWLWIVTGLVSAFVWAIVTRGRSEEQAVYVSAGAHPDVASFILVVEAIIGIAVASWTAVVTSLLLSAGLGSSTEYLRYGLIWTMMASGIAVVVTVALAVLRPRRSALELVKD